MTTTVTNFKAVKQHWNRETCRWDDPKYLYIGRYNKSYGLRHSPWHNPFVMGAESERERVIELYRVYLKKRIEEGRLDLEELRGKTLICWCAPLACHGDVIRELLGESE